MQKTGTKSSGGLPMHDFEVFSIGDDFSIDVVAEINSPLDEREELLVDEIWREERDLGGKILFNHKFLAVQSFDKSCVKARLVEYKYYLAQERVPSIRDKLKICPLALSGVTTTEGKRLLFGMRSIAVTEYPLFWELAPAGGVSEDYVSGKNVDIRGQMLEELREETGIDEEDVLHIIPRLLVLDKTQPLLEIVLDIRTKETAQNPFRKPSAEYEALEWVKLAEIGDFIGKKEHMLTPPTKIILKNWNF